jgi:hypothetical protein
LNGLLQNIEGDIKNNSTEYEGSEYFSQPIHQVFRDKEIRINKYSPRADGQEDFCKEKNPGTLTMPITEPVKKRNLSNYSQDASKVSAKNLKTSILSGTKEK